MRAPISSWGKGLGHVSVGPETREERALTLDPGDDRKRIKSVSPLWRRRKSAEDVKNRHVGRFQIPEDEVVIHTSFADVDNPLHNPNQKEKPSCNVDALDVRITLIDWAAARSSSLTIRACPPPAAPPQRL